MFATLRRNKTWLWGILIIVVIVSFVIFFSPDVDLFGRRGESGTAIVAHMDGKPIPQDRFQEAYHEAAIRYFITYGQWPQENRGWDSETQAKQRLFLKDRAAKLGIRTGTDAAVVWMKEFPAFKDKNGKYSPERYEKVIANMEKMGISRRSFESFAASEMAISQLMASVGASGAIVSPRATKAALEEEKEILVAQMAVFPTSNYTAQVNVDETNLTKFYSNRVSMYRVPEKMQVQYVAFPSSNYVDAGIAALEKRQKKSLAELIDLTYSEADPEDYKDEDGKVLSEADAKAKIRENTEKMCALQAARTAAGKFSQPYIEKENATVDDFLNTAKEAGLEVKLSPFFAANEAPEGMDWDVSLSRTAFNKLDGTNAFLPPQMGSNNVYAICFSSKADSYVPDYTNVVEKVKTDYIENETRTKARSAASSFKIAVTKALGEGGSFEDSCTKSNVTFVALPDFAADDADVKGDFPLPWTQISRSFYNMKTGDVSSPIGQTNNICLLYLKEKKPADPKAVSDALADYTTKQVQSGLNSAFQEWFVREYEKANIKTGNDIEKERKAAEEAAAKAAQEAAAKAQAASEAQTATANEPETKTVAVEASEEKAPTTAAAPTAPAETKSEAPAQPAK